MCFSATASFVAGGALSAVGGVSVAKVKEKKEYGLALVPLMFGVQQILEGIVWVSFGMTLNTYAAYGFLFFAFIVWPSWIPWMVYFMEEVSVRKRWIKLFGVVGVMVSLSLLMGLLIYDVDVQLFENHVSYSSDVPFNAVISGYALAYVLATLVPFFLSSNRFLNVFGGFMTVGFLVAAFFYSVVYISVWCFFAAVLSVMVGGYFLRR